MELEIDDDTSVMTVSSHTYMWLSEDSERASDKTLTEPKEGHLPTLDECLIAQSTDVKYDKIRPTVGIPESWLQFEKNRL